MQTLTYPGFRKNTFSLIIKNKTSTIIYHSIESFMGYKLVYKALKKLIDRLDKGIAVAHLKYMAYKS